MSCPLVPTVHMYEYLQTSTDHEVKFLQVFPLYTEEDDVYNVSQNCSTVQRKQRKRTCEIKVNLQNFAFNQGKLNMSPGDLLYI